MYFNIPVYIGGLGAYLPENRTVPTPEVAPGLSAKEIAEADYASIAIEDTKYPGAMASRAAREALHAARVTGEEIEVVVYAANHRHGHRLFWSPASFVQREIGASHAFAINVYAGCTAQIAMSDMALAYLLANDQRRAALVVAADRYSGTHGSRWASDYGIFFGDGAAAVVYTKTPGVARVLSVNTRTVAEFEEIHRMATESELTDSNWKAEYNVRSTKRRFMAANGVDRLAQVTREVTNELYELSLAEAGVSSKDIVKLLLPNLGRQLMDVTYFRLCEGDLDRCLWGSFGRSIGHIGPADQILALHHALDVGAVRPGDRVALMGAGAGFSWSCMIVEIGSNER